VKVNAAGFAQSSAIFSSRRAFVLPGNALGRRLSGTCKQPSPGRTEVQKVLLQLVKQYVSTDAPLSRLSSALLFERYGYFDKALEKIKDVLEPPLPLPTFPTPPPMTLRDVVAHLLQSSGMPRWIGEPYKEPQAGPKPCP
jgi:hypothetical protein